MKVPSNSAFDRRAGGVPRNVVDAWRSAILVGNQDELRHLDAFVIGMEGIKIGARLYTHQEPFRFDAQFDVRNVFRLIFLESGRYGQIDPAGPIGVAGTDID